MTLDDRVPLEKSKKGTSYDSDDSLLKDSTIDISTDTSENMSVDAPVDTLMLAPDLLLESYYKLKNRQPSGNRYNYGLKQFCAFVRLTPGPLVYEYLVQNFKNTIPSLSTINRFIHQDSEPIVEGELMVEQLSKFLNDNGLPREVVLSEDATRVTGKLEYDTRTDECVGRALPFDDNSMPIPGSFPCTTVSQIENHFKHQDASKLLYVYMAQPIAKDAPSFCVGLFGTDKKFDSIDSLKRMVHLHNLIKNYGIKVLAHGSDGDPRLLRADKILSGLGQNTASQCTYTINGVTVAFPEIHGDLHSQITPMQDPPHIGTKMRNCFAKDSYPMAMGKYTAAVSNLEYLMQIESKDKHKLVPSDIAPTDRMNFKSVLKICSNECIQGLEKHVPGSDATRMYLTCMKNILQAALEKDLSIEERIYKMFNPLYFSRYWREWL
ncbi:hypothetical protein QAD02_007642 [Eretmocerus hayati]|uniref:Uncharacterized protein n=1 Tax=Eretmocerus hayati TaxID=131215 RepID=A0ACC2N475_9HYME|nr:hypothetical protein QAD02_007642 [Eretmocerus hayati]